MVYRRRRILLSELERQCGIALMAYDDAAAALQKHNADRFWSALQALTAAAGNLEGMLWPVPNAAIGWASELREALGLKDDSPLHHPGLAASRNISSALEDWQAGHPDRSWRASNFGPGGFTSASPADCVRYFDRELRCLSSAATVSSCRCSSERSPNSAIARGWRSSTCGSWFEGAIE